MPVEVEAYITGTASSETHERYENVGRRKENLGMRSKHEKKPHGHK